MSTHDYDFIKSASKLLGYEQEERRKEWYEELEEEVCAICPALTYQQRLIGCIIMMIIGFILSMGSLSRLVQLLAGNPAPFAIMYTLGNIVSISSTCFLFGPWAQAKKMFAMTRIVTTSVYFFCMAICLFLAFYPGTIPVRVLWLVIAVLCQFMALSKCLFLVLFLI